MSYYICPICGSAKDCQRIAHDKGFYSYYHCQTYYFAFYFKDTSFSDERDFAILELFDLILEHLLQHPYYSFPGTDMTEKWHFYYDEYAIISDEDSPWLVNLASSMKTYPRQFMDKVNRSLINLSLLYKNYGDVIHLKDNIGHALYCGTLNTCDHMLDLLVDLGYLNFVSGGGYQISAEGWKKIDELNRQYFLTKTKQGFIAMSFQDGTTSIREAFRKAICESGYKTCVIDEKEHNNQIVPELLYEIGRSSFIVVDVTYPNYGAYYEAGYAQALGKQVIICCRKAEFDSPDKRPHFDISQKSMIVWESEVELVRRLKRRIEATVFQTNYLQNYY